MDEKRKRLANAPRRLSTTTMNFQVPANEGAQEVVKEIHGEDTWRSGILHFLHSHNVHYILMFLLILDIVILFIEIFLIGHYPPCKIIERDCIACCPSQNYEGRFLEGSSHGDGLICENGFDTTSGHGMCDEGKWHTVHIVEDILFWFTITILAIFLFEIHAELIALGPRLFFRQFFYLLDYVIIVVSITLELLFKFDENLGLSTISGLIVLARIWRFVRIGHAIVEISTELTHKAYEELLAYTETLEAKLKMNHHTLPKCPTSVETKRRKTSFSQHEHEDKANA